MRILTVYEDVSAARTYKIKVSEDTGEIERELDVSAETPRAENGKLNVPLEHLLKYALYKVKALVSDKA